MIKKAVLIIVLILLGIFLLSRSIQRPDYSIDSFNKLSYPEDRGKIEFQTIQLEKNNNYTLEKIIYDSKGEKIYSLLYIPNSKTPVPALIYLPAAGAKKEALDNVAAKILEHKYAVIILDQRGIGETAGNFLTLEQEYQLLTEGKEPNLFKPIYDALRAFDILYKDPRIDKNRITYTGESLGARTAIIAAALEKRSKGAVVFSTAGFNNPHPLLTLIDPDNYVGDISPRKFVLFQSLNDQVVPFEYANLTFSKAKEPKSLIIMPPPCDHGWCMKMENEFFEVLNP